MQYAQTVWNGALDSLFGPKFVVIPIRGVLLDDHHQAGKEAFVSARAFENLQEKICDDDRVRGVLLRINSPGGLVTASEALYRSVTKIAEYVPVVAYNQSVCASGSYFLSLGANEIVSDPTATTGSVGVIASFMNFHRLADSYGVEEHILATGSLKGAGSPFQEWTEETGKYFEGLIEHAKERFYGYVSDERNIPQDDDRFARIATAAVFNAETALTLGLIDRVGRMHDAKQRLVALAAERDPDLLKLETDEDLQWVVRKPRRRGSTPRISGGVFDRFDVREALHYVSVGRFSDAELSGRMWYIKQ